jgi:transposase
VRTAYKCRAYPDEAQRQVLSRTFGCVRLVWNRTLAARHARWRRERSGTSYAQTDRALTELKKDPDLAFLNEVSSVPLQQALRHQHKAFSAFSAFFASRARYPGSSPAAPASPRTTPGRRSPCAQASCGWPRQGRRCGSSGRGRRRT